MNKDSIRIQANDLKYIIVTLNVLKGKKSPIVFSKIMTKTNIYNNRFNEIIKIMESKDLVAKTVEINPVKNRNYYIITKKGINFLMKYDNLIEELL